MALDALYLITLSIFFLSVKLIFETEGILLKDEQGINMSLLERKVTALETSFQSLKSQCACGNNNPVFMATLSTIITHCTTHQPVIFDKVKINIGSGYNSLHGNFRAPVSGVYAFSTTLSASSHNQYHVAIVKGNATNEIGYLFADPDTNWHMRSTTVFSHLNSGEEVWVVCLSDSSMQGYIGIHADDFDSHFSGFLVSAA